jgi:hypothetical protein
MKKILLSSIISFMIVFSLNAQSFSLSWDDVALGDTVILSTVEWPQPELVFHAVVHNNSNDNVNVGVIRKRIEIIENSSDYFCWGACYPPFLDTAGTTILINAGMQSADEDFSAHYEIHGTMGVSTVEYTFYNVATPEDQISVFVKYNTLPNDISETIFSNTEISDIYPNPALNFAEIKFDFPKEVKSAKLKFSNILGATIKEINIEERNGKLDIDVSDLNTGVYFYSLILNEKIFQTKKLIIK